MSNLALSTRGSLWIKVVGLSLALHAGVFAFLYFRPLLVRSPSDSLFFLSSAKPKLLEEDALIDAIEKNEIIQDVFEHILVLPSQQQRPYDMNPLPQGVGISPHAEDAASTALAETASEPFTPLFDEQLMTREAILEEIESLPISPLFEALQEKARQVAQVDVSLRLGTLDIPALEKIEATPYEDLAAETTPAPDAVSTTGSGAFAISPPHAPLQDTSLAHTQSPQTPAQETIRTPLFTPKATPAASPPRLVHTPLSKEPLTQYAFPQLDASASWDADFDINTTYAPHPDSDGYIFQVTLTPKHDLSEHRLKQHIYFLLDRSNSSERHHFVVFKRATLKALASLQPSDSFNILVLDKKITTFRPQTMPASPANIRAAEEFLDTQSAGTFLGNGNIYSALDKIPSLIPNDQDMHTAILLTDGNSSMTTAKKRDCLRKWLSKNQGKLSLYAGAVGQNNELLWLDLLSTDSGGRLVYSDTHAAFPRKLAKLILDLKNPLAKDIDILAKPYQSQTFIELYPTSSTLPSLYNNQPYVISGATDTLEPFELTLQGRHKEDWICIQKKVDFKQAKRGNLLFAKEWQRSQAHLCYTQFLNQGKPALLDEAKGILNRSQKEIAFK
jgi:hypothetical protein